MLYFLNMAGSGTHSGWMKFDVLDVPPVTPNTLENITKLLFGSSEGVIEKVGTEIDPHLTLIALGYKVTRKTLAVLCKYRDAIRQTYTGTIEKIFPISEQYIAIKIVQNEIAQLSQAILYDLREVGEKPVQFVTPSEPFGFLGHISLVKFDNKEHRDKAYLNLKSTTLLSGLTVQLGKCKLFERQPDGTQKRIYL